MQKMADHFFSILQILAILILLVRMKFINTEANIKKIYLLIGFIIISGIIYKLIKERIFL